MTRGPDGAPYVIDRTTRSVYRVDLSAKKATLVARVGMKQGGATFSNALRGLAGRTCSSSMPRTSCGVGGRPMPRGTGR
jgi:hypothetical protein